MRRLVFPVALASTVGLIAAGQTPAAPPPAPAAVAAVGPAPGAPRSPSGFLQMTIGADRTLADYRQMVAYFRALDAASARVDIESLGNTTLGEDMIMVVISSEANLKNKQRLQQVSRRLADPRGLTETEAAALIEEGRAVVLVTCNIHSTEIASSQMAMEWAHALATAQDAETRRRLDNVILLLVPSLNPDGQIMETAWYRKHLGTKHEGGRMPWLYHHYVGHDNNRDWFMLTQKETRHLSRAIYHDWSPQVFVDEHQMGQDGPRMFIPPFADPIDPDVHPLIWREVNLVGTNMAFRLEQQGKAGVIFGYSFDAYWMGGTRNTGWWKNITGLLLEVASARMATPVFIDATELEGKSKGLVDYQPQTNHPNPWRGGWWRMRDIMDYERIASDALLEAAADRREDLLRDLVVRARAAIADAAPGEAYRIPARQRDYPTTRRLALLMADHNVEVLAAPDGDFWIPLAQPYGRFVREMMEPQRYPEVKLMEGKEILRPYDVATWTLPLMMGVTVERAKLPAAGGGARVPAPIRAGAGGVGRLPGDPPAPNRGMTVVDGTGPEAAKVVNAALRSQGVVSVIRAPAPGAALAVGTVVLDATAAAGAASAAAETAVRLSALPSTSVPPGAVRLRAPRVGLYKPWAASMDEGWTRWLLEQYGFAPRSLDNKAIRAGGLRGRFDVIVLPAIDKDVIAAGRPKREEGEMKYFAELPAEYAGGLDRQAGGGGGGGGKGDADAGGGDGAGGGGSKTGTRALKTFVEEGGTLVAFGAACDYVIAELNVPVRNALIKAKREDFAVPGSLLRARVSGGHPVTWGLPSEVALFLDRSMAFDTTLPGAEMQRWVLASYPDSGRDVLLSGWIHGEDKLARRAAAVAMTYGKGKVVLLGFRPQHRAQTHATFPFVFNALYWSVL